MGDDSPSEASAGFAVPGRSRIRGRPARRRNHSRAAIISAIVLSLLLQCSTSLWAVSFNETTAGLDIRDDRGDERPAGKQPVGDAGLCERPCLRRQRVQSGTATGEGTKNDMAW